MDEWRSFEWLFHRCDSVLAASPKMSYEADRLAQPSPTNIYKQHPTTQNESH